MARNLPVPIGGMSRFLPSNEVAKSVEGAPDSRAADYARSDKSDATRHAYRCDFANFTAWCARARRMPLPASVETACAYLASLADSGLAASTITRRCAAITYAHRLAGVPPPTLAEPVKAVLRGIRRRIGVAVERKAPATARAIAAMLRRIPDTLIGKRDRALLLIGFAAALRRSELVALNLADVETVPDGVVIHVRRSKTDQEGQGHEIAIPRGTRLKPVEALQDWIIALTTSLNCTKCLADMPLFVAVGRWGRLESKRLCDRTVALIIKRRAGAARLDPAMFSGHSLRAGFVTSALEKGADPFKIMDVTRHKKIDTLKIYDRRAKAFKGHAGKDFL